MFRDSPASLSDVTQETIQLTEDALKFQGTSGGKDYSVDIEFFKPISTSSADSKYAVHPRNVQFLLIKKETDEEFWPRLLKDKAKEKNQVQTDWDKYVDEDEEDGGFDMSGLEGGQGLGGMGMGGMGMGGMGGMDMEQLMKQVSDLKLGKSVAYASYVAHYTLFSWQMGGMGGMGDMGLGDMGLGDEPDQDEDDDDEIEDLPELEEVK